MSFSSVPPSPSDGALERAAGELRALANATRLRVMVCLGDESATGDSLAEALRPESLPLSALRYHVRVLASAGLVEAAGEAMIPAEFRLTATDRGRQLTRSLIPGQPVG